MSDKCDDDIRLDYDAGYISKSPCRECIKRKLIPLCLDDCQVLSRIQTALIGAVSCSNNVPGHEEYSAHI